MAQVTFVKKSRKEQRCQSCGKIIPVGSAYQWISFNFGPTIVHCESCGFKPYETTSNEYFREVGRIQYDFEKSLDEAESIEELESLRDNTQEELESVKEELENKRDNLPEQFQDYGPGEIITQRIDNLEEVCSDLDNIDFELDEEVSEDLQEMIDKVVEEESLLEEDVAHLRPRYKKPDDVEFEEFEWTEEKIRERYQEWVDQVTEEKMDSISEELNEVMQNLEV